MRPRAVLALLLTVLTLAGTLAAAPAASAASGQAGPDGVRRLLIISLPTLSWADLEGGHMPNVDALLDQSAVADLSVRGVGRLTDPGDGYAMVGAGTRVTGAVDDELAFELAEPYEGSSAQQVFARRTGRTVDEGLVSLGHHKVVAANEDLRFGAEVSALGESLGDAGVPRAVIANADAVGDDGLVELRRSAALALTDRAGTVPQGRLGRELLQEDDWAPFGVRLNPDAVEQVFDEVWEDDAVVLVEGSDLARFDAYQGRVSEAHREVMEGLVQESTDELVGRLLERVDPQHDAVLIVGPYHAHNRNHLTVAGLRAPGVEPGLLRSATTRRSGFVQLRDLAPTVLDLMDVEPPLSMEGRPFERRVSGGSTEDRRDFLIDADRAARFRDGMVTPVAAWFIILNLVLAIVAGLSMTRFGDRLDRIVSIAALAILGFLPATYLAGLLPFFSLGEPLYWGFVLGLGAVIGALAALLGRRHPHGPLIWALGAVLGVLLVDMVLGAPLQINTVFGYSPTVAGRFAGFGNLAFAQLAGASLLLGVLLAKRIGGRRGAAAAIALFVVTIVIDGAPFWGSDVGGVLALVPGMGAAGVMLLGWRLRARTVAFMFGATVLVVGLFAAVDLARPPDSRTHLGRLVSDVFNGGFAGLETVVVRKLDANLSVLTSSVWTRMVPVVLAFIVFLLWRAPGRLREIQRAVPEALVGLLITGVLGFALNDSGIAVPGLMLGVVNASLVYLVMGTAEPVSSRRRRPRADAEVAGPTGPPDVASTPRPDADRGKEPVSGGARPR